MIGRTSLSRRSGIGVGGGEVAPWCAVSGAWVEADAKNALFPICPEQFQFVAYDLALNQRIDEAVPVFAI